MDKKELRKIYRGKRAELSEEEVENHSERIKSKLFDTFDFSQLNLVHTFLPMAGKKEINTNKIIEELWNTFPSVKLVIPKMVGEQLVSFQFDKSTPLVTNEWGIPEPLGVPINDNKEIELILMPLLAYDLKGNRIGYGKGFYDKFLTTCSKDVKKVGLSFFEPEKIIFADEFDIPLNYCITPDSIYKF